MDVRLMRRAFREELRWSRVRRRAIRNILLTWRGGIFFAAFRRIDMFLLHFQIFPKTMLLARATENERAGGDCGGDFVNTKMHNALAS